MDVTKTINCTGSQCSIAAQVYNIPSFPCTTTFTTTAENTP
jgi:hypothetical protein